MNFFGNSGGFGGPSRYSSGGGMGGFDGWKIDISKGPSFSSFGPRGFSSAATPKLFNPPSGMSFGARGSMGVGTALAARESMAGFSSGPNFGSSRLSVQVPSSAPRVEISAAKPGSVTRSEVPVPPKNSAPVENPADGAPKQPLSASRHLESAISSPIDAIASTGEKRSHGSDFARRDADLAQASKVREKAAGSAAADAPKSKPSLWKSGFGSIGKHILEEEIITGDPVRDWEIRQQAGVQDVKTILAAATVIAPGLSVSGKVAADGIKGALASGAIKVAAGGAKSAIKAAAAKVPGGPTFATPNGAPVVGALEAAPALEVVPTAVERSAAMAAKALLVPLSIAIKDDDSAVFFAKKDGEEKSQIADQSKGSDPSGGTGPSKKPEGDNERKIDTPKMRNDFVKEKEKSGEWIKLHEPKGGKSTWRNKDSTQYFQKTMEKNEIEVYNKHGKHIGVIKPNDGALRRELAKLGRKIEK